MALPIRVGRAGSDAWGRGSLGGPVNASGVKQDPQPVVGEGAKAVAGALDLRDQQVEPLGGAVRGAGCVVGEDLGAPAQAGAAAHPRRAAAGAVRRRAAAGPPSRRARSAERHARLRPGIRGPPPGRGARPHLGPRPRADDPGGAVRLARGGEGDQDRTPSLGPAPRTARLRSHRVASRLRAAYGRCPRVPGGCGRTLYSFRTPCPLRTRRALPEIALNKGSRRADSNADPFATSALS